VTTFIRIDWTYSELIKQNQREKYKLASLLRQGWVFSKRTCVFSGIQFTTHFIEFVVVETKHIVRSESNVILTRQTCGQRSGMAAGGKRLNQLAHQKEFGGL